MSKKKSFSGSTMTLRDFHGGSIPSDLPLPSAPGMTVERSSHDRPSSGGRINRGFGTERGGFLRQGSANLARSYEDKAFYFPNPANIGRNYDEDERKPVDSHSRRSHGVDSYEEHMFTQRQTGFDRPPDRYTLESRGSFSSKYLDAGTDGLAHEDFGLIPVGNPTKLPSQEYHQPSLVTAAYAQEQSQSYMAHEQPVYQPSQSGRPGYQHSDTASSWRMNNAQQPGGTGSVVGSGSGVQNVWTARRDGDLNRIVSSDSSGNDAMGSGRVPTVASRIAQASALEKVSSGRWNSRVPYSPIEQPQEQMSEYSQLQGHSYGGRGGNVGGDLAGDTAHVRYSAELSPAVYSDSARSGYNEYGRAGYSEPLRSFDAEQVTFQDSREQYGESVGRAIPASNSEWADRNIRYQESGRLGTSDSQLGRYTEDNASLSYGDIGWRGNTGQKDINRAVVTEGVSYVESGRVRDMRDSGKFGGHEVGGYPEPGGFSQMNSGWIGQASPTVGDYGNGRVGDGSRGVPDSTRRVYSIAERAVDPDSGLTLYPHNDGMYHSEGYKGGQSFISHTLHGNEDLGQHPLGYTSREHLTREASKSPYVSDTSKGVYANERNKGPVIEFDRSLPADGGRLQTPRVVRSNSTIHEAGGASTMTPSESEGKSERPKLKLLPRTKPLDIEPSNGFIQEGSGVVQGDLEYTQSISTSHSELPSGVSSATAAANMSLNPRANDVGEEHTLPSERPKLNLKPRSQAVDITPDSGSVKERMSVFGGARPRELVLKERGVDESLIVGVENAASPGAFISGQRPNSGGARVSGEHEYRIEKQDRVEERKVDGRRLESHDSASGRQLGRYDSARLERNESRGRKEGWFDSDKKEDKRGSDSRIVQDRRELDRPDVDKQDSWRRQNDPPTPGLQSPLPGGAGELSSRGSGRIGIASAAELAQAFSRSTSLGSGTSRGYLSQGSPLPRTPGSSSYESSGRSPKDAPFSRLTEVLSPAPRDVYVSGGQGGSRRMNAY